MEVLDASEFFEALFSKVIEMSEIRNFQASVVNFRNMTSIINFSITTNSGTESDKIIIPRVVNSPFLNF